MLFKKIAVLTCGRSDFSIYLPLLLSLESNENIELYIIAFGSHTSRYHGYTITQIKEYGFKNLIEIDASLGDDQPVSVAISLGLTTMQMANIWNKYVFDLVFCLGDRYEMFAAVCSTIPFNLTIAHLHGGEKTLGAIDNSFRHSISAMAHFHFVSCEEHRLRVEEIVEPEYRENVYNVGSLSLQNLLNINLMTSEEFFLEFNLDITIPTVLVTYHPETIDIEGNNSNLDELLMAFDEIEEQILITLPNNDTMGAQIREEFIKYAKNNSKVYLFDYLGVRGYYSAIKHCKYLLGNSSSGIIEAASFKRYAINVGDRQKGRCGSKNIIHIPCKKLKL